VAAYLVALAANLTFLAVWTPPPTGDEPHYLLYAGSLAEDHDLALTNDYESPDRIAKVFDGPLGTLSHARVFKEGEPIRPIHGPALPALIAPVIAAGGTWFAVRVALAVVTAAAIPVLLSILYRLGGGRVRNLLLALAVAVSYPYASYATQIYPDAVAAVLVLVGVRGCLAAPRSAWRWAGMAAALLLPWFHVRFAPLAAGITLGLVLSGVRQAGPAPASWADRLRWAARAALPAGVPLTLSLVALLGYDAYMYGEATFLAAYRDFPPTATGEISLHHLYTYSFGDLFSRQYGLLPVAPLYLAGLAGIGLAIRRWRWPALAAMAAVLAYYLPTTMKSFNAGFCPPGRFAVPVLILLALPLGLLIQHRLWLAPVALLAVGSVALGWSVAIAAHAAHYPDSSRREWPVVVDSPISPAFPVTPESIYPRHAVLSEGADRTVDPAGGTGEPFASAPIPVLSPATYVASFDVEVRQGSVRLEITQGDRPLAATEVPPTARAKVRLPFAFPPGATDLDARASALRPSAAAVHGVAIDERPPHHPLWLKSLTWLVALLVANLFLAWTGGRRPAQTPMDPVPSEAPPEPVGVAPGQDG
jgi:hypothetical protein